MLGIGGGGGAPVFGIGGGGGGLAMRSLPGAGEFGPEAVVGLSMAESGRGGAIVPKRIEASCFAEPP